MNKLKFIMLLAAFLIMATSEGQPSGKWRLFGGKPKGGKVFKNPEKARKKQEAKERKMKREYELFIKRSKKRSYAIQSDEVKARMKQNVKNTKAYYRTKGKKQSAGNKKAGRKYN